MPRHSSLLSEQPKSPSDASQEISPIQTAESQTERENCNHPEVTQSTGPQISCAWDTVLTVCRNRSTLKNLLSATSTASSHSYTDSEDLLNTISSLFVAETNHGSTQWYLNRRSEARTGYCFVALGTLNKLNVVYNVRILSYFELCVAEQS